MGVAFSRRMGNLPQNGSLSAPKGSCVVCDDCGQVFTISQEITSGNDKKKRCERCAARVCEEKMANSPYARKCSNCQAVFGVTDRIAELPSNITVNCQRCSEMHRSMIKSGAYLEVILQRGDDKLYICCPRSLQSELRRCLTNGKQQGYNVLPPTPEESHVSVSALGFQEP